MATSRPLLREAGRCPRLLYFLALVASIAIVSAAPLSTRASDESSGLRPDAPLSALPASGILSYGINSPAASCTLRWQGTVSFLEQNSLAGGYRLSAYQDPTAAGCLGPYPFGVTDIWWTVYFAVDAPIQVQLFLFHDTGTVSCPIPGGTLFAGPVHTVNPPSAGPWIIRMSLADTVCINEPYFAGLRIVSEIDTGIVDILIDTTVPQACRTYRDTANGWSDLVVDDGFDHNMQIWSSGLDQSQNGCPADQCPISVSASPDPVNATVGIEASATVTASDPDGGGALQYYLVGGPGAVDGSTGIWSYTPTCDDLPGFTVTVEASDRGAGGCPQSQVSFQVNVAPPLLSLGSCTAVNIHWGDTGSQQMTSAGGCLPITFTKLAGPGTVTPAGFWSFGTDCGDVGDDSVTIRASDAAGQMAVCTFDVVVTNISPTCQSPVAASAPYGELTQIPLGPATDPDGDVLLYILDSGPSWSGMNGTNWVATRPEGDSADYTVCFSVTDGCATSSQCCFTVTESCHCECHADPQCDGVTDILDVVLTIGRAFRAASSIPFCPGFDQIDGRTDVDCSGGTDVLDVVKMIDVAFRGADPAMKFCTPCAP